MTRPSLSTSPFLTSSADVARELGIPRLVFHVSGLFSLTVHDTIHLQSPHLSVSSDSEPFLVSGLPHRVELIKSELPETFLLPQSLDTKRDAEKNSFGIIVNTFFDLEPEYAEIYMKEPGRRTWLIGPVSLVHKDKNDLSNRGQDPDADPALLLSWLDTKPASSVLYVCFGSLCEFGDDQLNEIGAGLEASGHPFIWVVRRNPGESLSPRIEEIKKRVGVRGIIVHGWAPQVVVLGHPAVGGFMTHCGWNSTLEAVCAGVAMVAWPLFYEQFINQRLITDVLKIGVRVPGVGGNMLLMGWKNDVVKAQEVAGALERVMGKGEEAEGMRRRAREFGKKARLAMEEGGVIARGLGPVDR
ncbi:scopoletin glucosyltransferase-like [Phoenix dactylifera]|uniref:Scopoletin glucosyltransferase-like n=1 Tax=Phoenix dactylifera TaxID=42345 RepID=A0A8B8ZLV8_PHODC|nr:scopoletin glucosyltransferase-like [Phoenix dactylifera]